MSLKSNIKKLSMLCGVSGFEHNNAFEIKKIFEKYCDTVDIDTLGNVIGVKKGINSNRKVMIEAHMDEIGMMITKIDDNGFLYFTNIGGIDARILLANKVTVHGKSKIRGVIGAKPPHLLDASEVNKTIAMDKLFIDIGLDKESAEKIVSIGDTITFDAKFIELSKKHIATKCQDDRTSVAVIIDVLEKLKDVKLPFDLYAVATVQEEVGRRGAGTSAYLIDPSLAIAIDVCHATTPDSTSDAYNTGCGVVITKGPNLHTEITNDIIKSMDDNKIKYVVDVENGDTGTDAWAIQIAQNGIPTVLFSLPLRYMHTPFEVLNIDDAKETSKAIYNYLISLES